MKQKKPNYPEMPSFQRDPYLESSQKGLSETGNALRTGRFMDPNDPTVGFLNQLVALNPEYTRTAVDLASRDVIRMRDQAQQNILNELEANNQLSSSVTGNRLSDLNEAFSSDIADIASQFYLADVERSMANISALFGTGLDTLNAVSQTGLGSQAQMNDFAMQRYDREVALENERFQRQQENDVATAQLFGQMTGGIAGQIYGGLRGNPQAASVGFNAPLDSASGLLSTIMSARSGGQMGGNTSQGTLNQRLINANNRQNVGFGTPSKGGLV